MSLKSLLRVLLNRLDRIAEQNEEIFDSDVREAIGVAVMQAFVRGMTSSAIPTNLGMPTDESNLSVRDALINYVDAANAEAAKIGLSGFAARLAAFQDVEVCSKEGNDYEEYFGHTPVEFYDSDGNVVSR